MKIIDSFYRDRIYYILSDLEGMRKDLWQTNQKLYLKNKEDWHAIRGLFMLYKYRCNKNHKIYARDFFNLINDIKECINNILIEVGIEELNLKMSLVSQLDILNQLEIICKIDNQEVF